MDESLIPHNNSKSSRGSLVPLRNRTKNYNTGGKSCKVAFVLFVLGVVVIIMSSSTNSPSSTQATATAVPLTKRKTTVRLPQPSSTAFLPQNYSVEKPKPPPQRNAAFLWSSLVAGVGSGILASVVCAPLDVLRTRLQVWGDVSGNQRASGVFLVKEIFQQEGYKGAFRGLGATLLTVPAFWAIYFPLYDDLKRRLQTNNRNPSLVHCASAVVAGAAADIICNPMFVVRTRLQTEALHGAVTPSGIVQTIRALHAEGGPIVFWRGMAASLFGLTHVAVQFPLYEWLKKRARHQQPDKQETAMDLLVASGLSKMCASLLTYPHEVVRSRMMDARTTKSLRNTISRIYVKEGIHGFYTGLHISLLRVLPNCCITFLSYELLLRWSRQHIQHENPNDST